MGAVFCLLLLLAASSCHPGQPAQPVRTPTGTFAFHSEHIQLEVAPRLGGRVLRFGTAERNLLIQSSFVAGAKDAAGRNQFGSTFWISPQAIWNWPPEAAVDREPYEARVADGSLILTGAPGSDSRVSVQKHIRLGAGPGRVAFRYTMHNEGSSAKRVAPWEVSRVPLPGLVFFPSASEPLAQSTLESTSVEGIAWLDLPRSAERSAKLFQDGREGWLAYVANGLAYVKVFPDVSPAQAASNESEVEIYVSSDGYVELEQQGASVELSPGQRSAAWEVEWVVRPLPTTLGGDVRVGSKPLLAWVRSLVSG